MSHSNRSGIIISVALLFMTYTLGAIAIVSSNGTPKIEAPEPVVQEEQNLLPLVELPKGNFTEDARVCLAKNIYFEARNQSTEGQIAVALVTFNRVSSTEFPNTLCGVVWQSKVRNGKRIGQFSWTQDGKSDEPKNIKVWKQSYNLAASLLTQAKEGTLYDFTDGALFYHANYVAPKWSSNMTLVATIEEHLFYKPL